MAYDCGLADRVRSILAHHAGFSERQMFGGVAFMINGHLCLGEHPKPASRDHLKTGQV